MTIAHKRLNEIVEKRELKSWCKDNGLNYATMYKIAIGDRIPSYGLIASMCNIIPVIEWLFNEDEELPYKPQLIKVWDTNKISKAVKLHKNDWQNLIIKYNMTYLQGFNIFHNHRQKPSLRIMKEMCKEINPIYFFMENEEENKQEEYYILKQGDLVNYRNKLIYVLSKKNTANAFIGCLIVKDKTKVKLPKTISTQGYVEIETINKYVIQDKFMYPVFVERTEKDFILEVNKKIVEIFE